MKRNALVVAVAATLVSVAAWAGPGMGFGGGMGRGYGMGMGGGACMEQGIAELGLTAEQRDKIAAIQTEVSTKKVDLMASMRELRTQAFRNGTADAATTAAMADLREQMLAVNREGRERVEAVLTPEQRAQWRPGRRGAPWRG